MNDMPIDTPQSPADMAGSTIDRAADEIGRAGRRAGEVARQSARRIGESTEQFKARLNEMSGSTIAYVRDEPVRSMLIVVGVCAALITLVGALRRARH